MQYYQPPQNNYYLPNLWDLIAFITIISGLTALAWGAMHMSLPYHVGEIIPISLSPVFLGEYAIYTVVRMFLALFISLIFTFVVGSLAAKNRHAERIILPLIDVLQSLPILGMLAITVVIFISLFPGSMLGPECAAIFAIFTSQVWNMTLSFYQSLKSIPEDLLEASKMFRLNSWARFWRIEVPFAMPSLLWNTMVSMSAGWFFVVASEAISVSNQLITLPGIGSYINQAIIEANFNAIFYATLAMFLIILCYDQLLFRPLLKWAERFKSTTPADDIITQESWFYDLLTKTRLLKHCQPFYVILKDWFIMLPLFNSNPITQKLSRSLKQPVFQKLIVYLWHALIISIVVVASSFLIQFIYLKIGLKEISHVLMLGLITGFKVILLVLLSSLFWIPVGVWIGRRPYAAKICQPIAQFLAAFPVNLVYPFFVFIILEYSLNVNIWTTPLMILGTQWYILFNVIAGVAAIPAEILWAAKNLQLKGWIWWKRVILPAIFPYYVTGAMTAAGGCWNASIVADYVKWGEIELRAVGLGSYITEYTSLGDFPRIVLGIATMGIYVLILNHFVWQKLYRYAVKRFT